MSSFSSRSFSQHGSSIRLADLNVLKSKEDAGTMVRHILGGRTFKRELEQMFLTNVDFLEGGVKQWQGWSADGQTRRLDPQIKDQDQLLTWNFILEIVETMVSRLNRNEGVAKSSPVSQDRNDIQTAKILEDLLSYYYMIGLAMPVKLSKLFLTMACSPVCWQHGGWSAHKGDIVTTSFDDFLGSKIEQASPNGVDELLPEIQQEIVKSAQVEFSRIFGKDALRAGQITQYTGDLFAEIVTVLEMSWEPWNISDFSDVEVYVRTTQPTINSVSEMLDMKPEEIRRRATGHKTTGIGGAPLVGVDNRPISRIRNTTEKNSSEQIDFHRFHVKKCLRYPEGVEGVVLGNDPEAIKIGIINNLYHELPYFELVQHPLPDQAVGTCMVSQLRTGQMDTNKMLAQQALYREQAIWPTILVPKAGIVDARDWQLDNRPNAQKIISGGVENAPFELKRSTRDLAFDVGISRNIEMARELSSVSPTTVGKPNKTGVRSGRAIEATEEKTLERTESLNERINHQQSKFWTFLAVELMTKPTGDRVSQILGEGNQRELLTWNREKIRPTSFGLPNVRAALVSVDTFSDKPVTRAENRNWVLGLVKAGVLRPGEHDDVIWKMMGSGETKTFVDRGRRDRAAQNWEIEQWRQGITVSQPIPEQNHQVHADEIMVWIRAGTEYLKLIDSFPYLERHISHHLRTHNLLRLMNPLKEQMLLERAKAEAWLATIGDMQQDVLLGTLDKRVLEMTQESPQGPAILLPLEMALGVPNAGESAQPGAVGPAGPRGPSGGQAPPKSPRPTQPDTATGFVGQGQARDVQRDLADSGVGQPLLSAGT